MSLQLKQLKQSIRKAFEKNYRLGTDAEVTSEQKTLWDTLSEDISNAIDNYVKSGDVVTVRTSVNVDPNTGIGSGIQSNKGKII